MQIKRKYTPMQMLRFPLLFGGILSLFVTGFMYRKVYFGQEIEAVRQKNYEESLRQQEIMDRAKEEMAIEQLKAKSK